MTANDNAAKIIVYSTPWCPDCLRARKVLAASGLDYDEIDVSKDSQAAEVVKSMNNGNRSVPTILFPDGSFLVEPSTSVLNKKLEDYNR